MSLHLMPSTVLKFRMPFSQTARASSRQVKLKSLHLVISSSESISTTIAATSCPRRKVCKPREKLLRKMASPFLDWKHKLNSTAKWWSNDYGVELNETSVRSVFQPAEGYRISRYRYPTGAVVEGGMIVGMCIVFQGHCRFFFDQAVCLRSGQYANLPGGAYKLVNEGECVLELMLVWKLPQPKGEV